MEKIRFGIIGTNKISDRFISGARLDSRFALSAVCSRSIDTARDFAQRHGIDHLFTSVEEMAASDKVDAVYIATPNSLHAAQSIICMNHGKHVLCEKPLASNAAEVRNMIEASARNGVTLMEAMKTTLTPNFRRLLTRLGDAGKIRRYFASYCQYSSRYDKLKQGFILNAFNPAFSNGAVMDIGTYTIYPMVVLFGKPATITAHGLKLPSGVDGQGAAIFGYGDMDAEVIYSKIADSRLPSEIQGEDGTILIDNIHTMKSIRFIPRATGTPQDWTDSRYLDEYYYEAAEFIDMVLGGHIESPVNTHACSLATIEIIDEIRRLTGITFPADTQR